MKEITWNYLNAKNAERQLYWVGSDKIDLAFLGLEIGEEAGEVQGALKKLIRHRDKIDGNSASHEELRAKLNSEIGDLIINISRLANALDLDVDQCIRTAFDNKSIKLSINVNL